MNSKYLLSEKKLRTLNNLSVPFHKEETDLLWKELSSLDGHKEIKILVDEEESSKQIAEVLNARWNDAKGGILTIIEAATPPVASYLKTVKKLDISSTDYLIAISQPIVWGSIIKRLSKETDWDISKVIFSSNLKKPEIIQAIGPDYYNF